MKYIMRTTTPITKDYVRWLLQDRGILPFEEDSPVGYQVYDRYMNPTKKDCCDTSLLDNIYEGTQLLIEAIEKNARIYIVVDSDVDGYTSAAVLYSYTQQLINELKSDATIEYHIPLGKEHGLETIADELEKTYDYERMNLIMLPDSSSNDYDEHKRLSDVGYKILVLDHHEADKYSEHAVVINNQLSQDYPNKSLSGVGVVWKFCKRIDEHLNLNWADEYLDLVALGEISDMMSMNTLENRYILKEGLSNIKNKFLKDLIEKQAYSLGDTENLTQIGIAFYVTPSINALIRVGNQIEKENLFKAFICGEEIVPSTKRGDKGNFEALSVQAARNCTNAKARQNREKEKAIELLDIQIQENCYDENKILILNADDLNVSTTLTGLCAMGITAKYKRPTILGRINSEGHLRGSIRGLNDSELKDFRQFLLDSNLCDYVEG